MRCLWTYRREGICSTFKCLEVTAYESGRPLLKLAIKGVIVPALIDTGVSRSLLRLDVFESIQKATHSPLLLQTMTGLKTLTGA